MKIKHIILTLLLLTALPSIAGVYADLEFGDSRADVQRKLQSCDMVEQTMEDTFISRVGLNGLFKCKAKLAGLTYHLYFKWNDRGQLSEITLRSNKLARADYKTSLYRAWKEAGALLTQVYETPVQNAGYPEKNILAESGIMMSHLWHKGKKESIMMGTGLEQAEYFLAIRFVDRHVKPAVKVRR